MGSDARRTHRYIVSVEPRQSVPVKCIEVDTDDHLYLAGRAMVPTHNTFVALDWTLSIVTGRRWCNHDVVEQPNNLATPVIYVSGEGHGGIAKRRNAWRMMRHEQRTAGWFLIPYGVNLLDDVHVRRLEEDVYAHGAKLLVIDTLARSLVGGDENSAQDMGKAISALDRIRRAHGCASLVVHHTGTEQTRPRGSTALFGAADTVINCVAEESAVTLWCKKQKDAAPFHPIGLRARPYGDSVALARAAVFVAGEVI